MSPVFDLLTDIFSFSFSGDGIRETGHNSVSCKYEGDLFLKNEQPYYPQSFLMLTKKKPKP